MEASIAVFFRFQAASPSARSSEQMRYITRPSAVREGRQGLLVIGLPDFVFCCDMTASDNRRVPSTTEKIQSYATLRASLIAWAKMHEALERFAAPWNHRSHYRALFGFERDVGTARMLSLVKEWFAAALPEAMAVAAVHRDTHQAHVHLWVDARKRDGRKINLSAREWRQLDETWNSIYCRALGLDEREHLVKKWATERAKELWRRGELAGRDRNTGEVALPRDPNSDFQREAGQRPVWVGDCAREKTLVKEYAPEAYDASLIDDGSLSDDALER